MSTQCPCTKTVRAWTSNSIHQIFEIWRSIPLHFAMHPIVDIVASPLTMNTHSKKWHHPNDYPSIKTSRMGWWYSTHGTTSSLSPTTWMITITSTCYKVDQVYMTFRTSILKISPSGRGRRRILWEKGRWGGLERKQKNWYKLKRELRLIHKWSHNKNGQLGIVWWNREYWDNRMGLKRLRILNNGLKV